MILLAHYINGYMICCEGRKLILDHLLLDVSFISCDCRWMLNHVTCVHFYNLRKFVHARKLSDLKNGRVQ